MAQTSSQSFMKLPRTAEVVIVGGGVVGVATAFQLAKAGVSNILLVERGQLAAGASGKSGALVRAHYSNAPETQLTLESLKVFRTWDDMVGVGDPRFRAIGFLRVVHPEDESKLRANVEVQQQLGGDIRIVTREEIREIEPLMNTDDFSVAAFEPTTGYADPNATVYGFARAAVDLGVTIALDTEATEIQTESGKVTGVATSRGTVSTAAVVVAAGGFADTLLMPLGIDLGLMPRRIQVAVFRWPWEMDHSRMHRVVIDSIQHSWIRPEGESGTLIGAEHGVRHAVDPDNYPESVEPDYIDRARGALAARFPIFQQAVMRGSWSGVVMQSPDDHPIVDHIPSVSGLFVSTGDSGSSFKTAPAVGLCLAQWITAGEPQLMDMTPFRSTRFAEGQPWIDENAYVLGGGQTVSR
ncbi:FAD-binding oxidoreductase [soil metagenome]